MFLMMQVRRGKQLQADTFPEAILNGAQLDLNALYRAVCGRGGFATGIGVNWAGQVCCMHGESGWQAHCDVLTVQCGLSHNSRRS